MPVGCVTGASGGIGAAIAVAMAERGIDLCLHYHASKSRIDKVAEAAKQLGVRVHTCPGDTTVEADVRHLFASCELALGPLDYLVNAVGILPEENPVLAHSLARWEHTFAVNTFGVVHCCQEAVARMSTLSGGAGGAIVNVSSVATRLIRPGFIDYAASKHALEALTVGLAREVAPLGVRVNGVRPGLIDTPMNAQRPDDVVGALTAGIPMARMGTPEEVAAAVCWLLSPEADYITGTHVDVAGGL